MSTKTRTTAVKKFEAPIRPKNRVALAFSVGGGLIATPRCAMCCAQARHAAKQSESDR